MNQTISVLLLLAFVPCSHSLSVKKVGDLSSRSLQSDKSPSCSPLDNHEVYSSLRVAFGNPPQTFDLVADTGSDYCIVSDCSCSGCPAAWGSCFTSHRSKSFNLPMFKAEANNGSAPAHMLMRFGSGDISTKIASDEVQIGPLKVFMENGVLLMVDQSLALTGHFEGILGLGSPLEKPADEIQVPGFLERAEVQRFSLCFNHKAAGVLGFDTPKHSHSLASVGKVHWSLNFHGITLGQENGPELALCSEGSRCSIIPDSGTTLMVGPEQSILRIYDALCSSWDRCNKMHQELKEELYLLGRVQVEGLDNATSLNFHPLSESLEGIVTKLVARSNNETPGAANLGRLQEVHAADATERVASTTFEVSPAMALRVLLERCTDWINEVDINTEMPTLSFHMTDKHGKQEQLKISPRNYVFLKTVEDEVRRKQICAMAFSPADYVTETDGQIWILGMPLFYEYTAHYDRGQAPQEVTMGFTARDVEECGQCKDNTIVRSESLLSEQVQQGSHTIRVGLDSLNSLSKEPIIRDLSHIDHL